MTVFAYTSGDPNNLVAAGPASMADIQGPLVDLKTFLNSRTFNEDNLPVATLQRLGLNDSSGQKGHGKNIIAASGTRANAAYGALTNGPDAVTGVVVPADSLVRFAFRAIWQESVTNAAAAAIFIGNNQFKIQGGSTSPIVQATQINAAGIENALSSAPVGLVAGAGGAYTGDVTTGMALGTNVNTGNTYGETIIEGLVAGTYDFSVRFLATSGTVTVHNRRLWVKVESYA